MTEPDFENGVRMIREAFRVQLANKEAQIVKLTADSARKDAHVKDLEVRISQLESQLLKSEKRSMEMTKILGKLQHFKQNVMHSFDTDELDALGFGPSYNNSSLLGGDILDFAQSTQSRNTCKILATATDV